MRKKVMNSSFPGHAPGKDTLRAANAATKVGANGGENARASVLRSEGVCSPVKIKIPVASADMRRHSDTLRAANAAMKEGANGGENTRTSFLRSEGVVVPVNNSSKEHRKQIMLAKP